MASPDRRESTGVDRRASMRTSMRLSRQPDDEDEYALAAMGISDGFRPADMAAGPQQPAPQSISSNVELPPVRRASPPPRPSSISKPKMDSFALRHDGQMGPVTQRNIEPVMTGASSSSSQMPSRMSSASSINPYVRPESPYRGPSGPSHNYGMYSQESRAQRTASISTIATVPVVERNYTGPSGPTHPYGMYPQNTVPEVEHPSPIAQIPVGFPGHNSNTQFQRRIGPEGEEAGGIIGPDGHQEELPPYTQYPDEAFARKTRPTIVAPVLVPGAGGMGVATRNPEFDSREGSVNTPQSRQSTRSFASDGSVHQVNTAAMGASEKPELKHWQIVARRKLCGIVPIWVLVLVFSMFVLFGIILGSVFAALKPKNQHKQSSHPTGQAQSQVTTTMTTTFDATPFTTVPAGLPSLPTGTFALPIQIPITVQSSCIDNSAQSSAWACNIAQGSQLQMNVQSIPGMNPTQSNEVMIDLGNDSMNVFPYGAQPPVVTTSQVMSLVTDSQDTNKGPAWFFQLPYNKLVVLPENALSVSNTKRESATFNQIGDFMRRGVAQPGDRPWFCYWNGTLLEAFIYVNLTSSAASQSQTTTSSAASTASRTGSASAASSTSSSSDDDDPIFLAPYPRVIKVEERRVPEGGQTISPYCIQQVIDQNGSPSPALNSTGQQIRLYLNETEPTTVSPISDKRDLFAALEPRDGHPLSERASDANCGCVWMYS